MQEQEIKKETECINKSETDILRESLKHKDHSLDFSIYETDYGISRYVNVVCKSCIKELGRVNLILILRNLG